MPKDINASEPVARGGTSPSEEMYLITVAMAEEEGREGPLPLAALARALSISPVSVNQMVWRLVERGLLQYHPYHGVVLTTRGRVAARRVLRGRRLWAGFLVKHLGFGREEADALACEFEHVTTPLLADRLEAFLQLAPAGSGGRQGGHRS